MRLIDADALKEYILRSVPNWSEDREIVLDCLANSPTIEERKKGKWEWSTLPITGALEQKCSICGTPFYMAFRLGMNYCPNCGAYMRGGEK